MFQFRGGLVLQFGDDLPGQHLSRFNTPLIERIDIPYRALREDIMFVKRDQRTEGLRRKLLRQDDIW